MGSSEYPGKVVGSTEILEIQLMNVRKRPNADTNLVLAMGCLCDLSDMSKISAATAPEYV